MNSKQRVLAAVAHREPDRVPITFDAEKEVYDLLYRELGVSTREALFDRMRVDTWMVQPRHPIPAGEQAARKEKTALWGYKTRAAHYSGGVYHELCFSPLAGKHDLKAIDSHPWPPDDALDFSGFPAEARAHADRAIIGTFTWGAYFIASFVRGMEDLMMDFALRKEYARHLIDRIEERMMTFLDRMLTRHSDGIDIVYMADDYCSQLAPLFSPQTFEEFVFPYLSRVAEKVHRHHKKFLLHVCGAVRPLLPLIIEAGADMLEPIQVRAKGMEPAGLKRDFGKDLCFYGGVDLQRLLCQGTPEQVSDGVKRLINVLGENGGYILGPGHTYIQVDAPFENIMAMYETAYSHRR